MLTPGLEMAMLLMYIGCFAGPEYGMHSGMENGMERLVYTITANLCIELSAMTLRLCRACINKSSVAGILVW